MDRALGLLRLFVGERSEWTVEAAARELGLSQSTAYEYVRSLVNSGLLSTHGTGRYVVGPAIIELDRQTRRRDPLILAASAEMDILASLMHDRAVVLLCRLYKLTVMCVDQRAPASPRVPISYERGRPMALDRGSASKVILANLPLRTLRRVHEQMTSGVDTEDVDAEDVDTEDVDAEDWAEYRKRLQIVRKAGLCIVRGELDPGRTGISAPVFGAEGEVIGSIGLVLSDEDLNAGEIARETQERVIAAGQQVSAALRARI